MKCFEFTHLGRLCLNYSILFLGNRALRNACVKRKDVTLEDKKVSLRMLLSPPAGDILKP